MQLNILKSNRKTVNYHYLTKYVQGRELSTEDSLALAPIALQTPYQGGNAVFGARVMLGIDPDDFGLAYKTSSENEPVLSDAYRIYPNPATTSLTIALTEVPFGQGLEIVITDLLGNVVFKEQPKTSAYSATVNVQPLASGVYLLQVVNGAEKYLVERIVITK